MLFQSIEFICYFFPVVFVGYWLLATHTQPSLAKVWLIGASLTFYSWWQVIYLPILVGSVLINFGLGVQINKGGLRKRLTFILALVFNLGLLFVFKYYDFFISNFNSALDSNLTTLGWLLPLGISFFTFQNIAYQVDAFEGFAKEPSLVNYALFITFFPQLIAGPIVHHAEMMPQFAKKPQFNINKIYLGAFVFSIGFLKKVALSDVFGLWANQGYSHVATLSFAEAWATSVCYTFQLYFDFSGYTDMAIGLALFFGINLPENFDSPFKSLSIIEFWQRWHMTLTRFLNAYLYTPIMRQFRTLTFTNAMLGTFVAMVLTGFWHGASWTFVLFGAMHGLAIIVNHIFRRNKWHLYRPVSWILTVLFFNAGFVVFRTKSLTESWQMFRAMVGGNGVVLDPVIFGRANFLRDWGVQFSSNWLSQVGALDSKLLLFIIMALVCVLVTKNTRQWREGFQFRTRDAWAMAIAIFLCFNVMYSNSNPSEFLYFNF